MEDIIVIIDIVIVVIDVNISCRYSSVSRSAPIILMIVIKAIDIILTRSWIVFGQQTRYVFTNGHLFVLHANEYPMICRISVCNTHILEHHTFSNSIYFTSRHKKQIWETRHNRIIWRHWPRTTAKGSSMDGFEAGESIFEAGLALLSSSSCWPPHAPWSKAGRTPGQNMSHIFLIIADVAPAVVDHPGAGGAAEAQLLHPEQHWSVKSQNRDQHKDQKFEP